MASQYDVGDSVRMSAAFTVSSVATDPTTITFKMREPDGTVTTYVYGTDAELVKDSTGNYHVDWGTSMSGDFFYRFTGTGACVAASEGYFTVKESRF